MSVRIGYTFSSQKALRTIHESVSANERKSSGLTRMRRSRHVVQATEALCRRGFDRCFICDSSDEVCSSLTIAEGFMLSMSPSWCAVIAKASDSDFRVESPSD